MRDIVSLFVIMGLIRIREETYKIIRGEVITNEALKIKFQIAIIIV